MPGAGFDWRALHEVVHRPWPMPRGPWIMTQTWSDLLFAHWPVDPAVLGDLVPPALELDLFDGRAWLGIVPFRMTNVAPRGLPAVPWLSAFPELNVRTYVRVGRKPGVYFFSLDAARRIAVYTARLLFALPYYAAAMSIVRRDGTVDFRSLRASRRRPAELVVTYWPTGPVFVASPGSLEHFLTERYCLYAVRQQQAFTVEIHHPPWRLQTAQAEIRANRMAEAAGIRQPDEPPLVHFAARQDVVNWARARVDPREPST